MPEPQKVPTLPIKDDPNVPCTYVNDVASWGVQNGVLNLTFVTAYFTPTSTAVQAVAPDLRIASRLRMDMLTARSLYDVLDAAFKAQKTQSMPQPTVPGIVGNLGSPN